MSSDPTPIAAPAAPMLTHPCVRCGKPTDIDRGLCEECNPLGLRDASASQVHGIALVGVILAIVALAVVARFAVGGIGPFEATVGDVQSAGSALTVTVEVTNTGAAPRTRPDAVTDASSRGLGQLGMRERVAAAGGRLELGPRSRGGYLVRAEFPLRRTEEVRA